MSRVEKAIESGRCALAVGGALLRDAEVMLALNRRAGLTPMALTGPAVAHSTWPVNADAVGRAVAQPGGLLILVEPELQDVPGVKALGELLGRARNKPDVIVVARSFNPFMFGTALSGLRVSHEKSKGKAFLLGLPEVAAPEASSEAPSTPSIPKASKAGDTAPRFCFAGRDEETEALAALLAEGGPIVVSGPSGIGRTLLVEHAIRKAGLERLPDLWLGWGMGHDTVATRLAHIGREIGENSLFEALSGPHDAASVNAAAAKVLNHEGLKGKVLVVHELERGMGREQDFFRRSRLELLLISMLTGSAAMPVVFVSTRQPRFHREGEAQGLRRVEVGGVKGRFLHEIFEANKAPEFPRDKFGPISERIHGHCFAAKTYAVAMRTRNNGVELADDAKFMRMENEADLAPITKQIDRRLEKLPADLRTILARLAHLRLPVDGTTLANELGVNRAARLELLSLGLLDMIGTEEDRKYHVHPVVRGQLAWREIADFEVCARMADMFASLAKNASGLEKLALEQEQSRFAVAGRALRLRPRLDLPDHDMWLDAVEGMLRSKQPRFDLAEQRLAECLKQNPHNADAWLLKLELAFARDDKAEAIDALLEEAVTKAPVPEIFQQVTSWLLGRRQRTRAITVLERGLALFPVESRLHTRLAAVLQRQGRRNEAIEHLRRAMEIDPMLPDSYGLLGLARREEGGEGASEAESLLREAVRLAPGDPVQVSRLADLLIEKARVETDAALQTAIRKEAHELLDDAIRGDRRAPEACLLLATLVREESGDVERAAWLLGQAKKLTERNHERNRRIQVERALVELARGDMDAAENTLRQLIGKEPGFGRAFAALGHVLEAREQFIPAHAEYMRAKERTAQGSLESVFYDQMLLRVQAIIEAQAAGLWTRPEAPERAPQPSAPSTRVLRRRGHDEHGDDGEGEADGEAVDAPPSEEDVQPDVVAAPDEQPEA